MVEKLQGTIRNLADAPDYEDVVSSWNRLGERYSTYEPPARHWFGDYLDQLDRERADPRAADHLRSLESSVRVPELDDAPAPRLRRMEDGTQKRYGAGFILVERKVAHAGSDMASYRRAPKPVVRVLSAFAPGAAPDVGSFVALDCHDDKVALAESFGIYVGQVGAAVF